MTTEYELNQAIAAKQAEYLEAQAIKPASQVQGISDELKALRLQLSDLLSAGAKPCPECGEKPHGMKRGRGLYEVGCLNNSTVENHPHGSIRAQGETAGEAVAKWNEIEA